VERRLPHFAGLSENISEENTALLTSLQEHRMLEKIEIKQTRKQIDTG
jgi:hypothetical protein